MIVLQALRISVTESEDALPCVAHDGNIRKSIRRNEFDQRELSEICILRFVNQNVAESLFESILDRCVLSEKLMSLHKNMSVVECTTLH